MKNLKFLFAYFNYNFSGFLNRCAAFTVLAALLVPVFLFQPIYKTSANALPVSQATAVISAPPEAFIVSEDSLPSNSLSGLLTSAVGSFLLLSGKTISRVFEKPKIPAGLEQSENQLAPAENLNSENNNTANPLLTLPPGSVRFDFDGDGKADVGRWRASNTEWKIKNSLGGNFTTTTIGSSSSIIAPGDFDGDGKTDVAVFNAGTWTIKKSSNNQTITVLFGSAGDKPVVGDYDGDGSADCAVFRPSTNTWWILRSSDGNHTAMAFGAAGDITTQGNFDGDSKTDVAVFRPSTGDWHVWGSSAGYFGFHWGVAADIPVPADYDGDGKTDFAVYRGSAGTWYVSKSSTNNTQYFGQVWGNYGDQPIPADYDGDGKDDFAVWRPTNGVWHIIKSAPNSNPIYDYQTLGQTGDKAIPSAYLKQISGAVLGYDLTKARLSPQNSTGGADLYSRNFNWATSLVGLSGRTGLDMGFGISYNSLVWTKEPVSNAIYFDADNSNVSPGFRFGFPTIEPSYWDKDAERFNYLMVSSSGARFEFRQLDGASDTYETADSSYLQIKTTGAANPNDPVENITLTLSTTDGTKMTYLWKAGAFRCSQIKDRNGNYITVNHDEQGLLRTVTDTLGRVITVHYDLELYPTSITQTWKNNNGQGAEVQHIWASFVYAATEINTSFAGGLYIAGPASGTTLKVLQKITFPSGEFTTFEYNGYAQVKKVNNYAADSHLLNYTRTNLDNPSTNQTDCPRFTETRNWVENFNVVSGVAQETLVANSITENSSYSLPGGHNGTATKIEVSMPGHPHGAVSKTFVGNSGWLEGLPVAAEDWANGANGLERKRWTWTNWTQDDTNLPHIQNPRIIESKVGDAVNVKRTTTEYLTYPSTSIAQYGLVSEVYVYDSNQSTILRKVETDYNLNETYISRRIIGLPSQVREYGRESGALILVSKAVYNYDEGNFNDTGLGQNPSSVTQHDGINFGATFIAGRGNLTSATRYDVSGLTANVTASVKYNTTGSVVAQIDPLGRTIKIGYADLFGDNQNRNTFAYPTKLYDALNNYSAITYRYDNGSNVRAQSPSPAGNADGKISTRTYDSIGRLQKETIIKNGSEYAYTRYEYTTNQVQSKVYSTITDTNNNGVGDSADEILAENWTDGAGRVLRTRNVHPGSLGGYSATFVEYDILGRIKRSTLPTEVDSNWNKAGDDAVRDWLWVSKEYDWKGRTVRQINSDGTDKLISYEGCGCAGGEIATVQNELVPRDDQPNVTARRTQKFYQDVLGRTHKTEFLNWDASIYSTITTTFNGRDQALSVKQYAGTTSNSTFQEATRTYDGHGRLKTEHLPQQEINKHTSYEYYNDDQIQSVTDGRGAIKNFQYNDQRGLLTQVSYNAPPSSEALHPQISAAGRGTDGTSIWIHGSNFNTDAKVVVATREYGTGNFVELGTFTGGQVTTGTTSNGQQSLTFQVNSQIVQTLNNHGVFVWVINAGSTRFSNQAYQIYNGTFSVIAPFTQVAPQTPSPVTFEYDAIGNRTLMTDSMGTVNYYYNQLSQLTSESRHFSGSNVGNDLQSAPGGAGIFNIAYDYDLGGKLKSITDPYGQTINYTQNKIGQTISITGSLFAGSNHSYASNTKYRAWGAVKSIDYVNNAGTTTESFTYNNRLLPETYSLYHASNGITSIQKQYQFYADGNPKYTKDGNPNAGGTMFDRSYKYDHMGRLTDARTGSEARGGQMPPLAERPYSFQRSYDVWGNAVSTTRNYWADGAAAESRSFVNNRIVGFNAALSGNHYDSDGRQIWADYMLYGYDSAGNQTHIESINRYKQDRWMDGENHLVREHITDFIIDSNHPDGHYVPRQEVKYYIRSTLLNGDVISESWRNGTKQTTFVYGFGKVLGRQQVLQNSATQMVFWEYSDSSRTSQGEGNQLQTNPLPFNRRELDPLGVDAGTSAPDPNSGGGGGEPWNYPRFGDPYEGDNGCTVDGVQTSCSVAYGLLGNGSAVQCPDNDCGPRTYYNHETGHAQLLYLNVQALQMGIGTSGFGPGFLPTNVGFSGSTFNIWSGTATFSLGGNQTTGLMTGQVNIFPTPENDFRLLDIGLDGASDGHWSRTMRDYKNSLAATDISKKATPDEKKIFEEAEAEVTKLFGTKENPSDCAKLFGGYEKAVKLLKDTKFVPKVLDRKDAIAERKGKTVSINTGSASGFFSNSPQSTLIFRNGFAALSGLQLRVFVILHELGHVGDIYGESNNDGGGSELENVINQGKNNDKIKTACFPDLKVEVVDDVLLEYIKRRYSIPF